MIEDQYVAALFDHIIKQNPKPDPSFFLVSKERAEEIWEIANNIFRDLSLSMRGIPEYDVKVANLQLRG